MFAYLSDVGAELNAQMTEVYWILLVPFASLLFLIEIVRSDQPNAKEILRRVLISVLLLMTFHWTMRSIAVVGDAVCERIDGLERLGDVMKNLGPNYSGKGSWFDMRETVLYVFSIAAYLIAYLGFFVATAMTHFVWTILYVASPLMILMYASAATEHVTFSLYKGLINVVIWKVLWSILGVLLLKLAMQQEAAGLDDYIMSIVLNLCIGACMLFIPVATKSLISDGMNSAATALSAAPTLAAGGAIKMAAAKYGGKLINSAAFTARPITNPIAGRMRLAGESLKPRMDRMMKAYGSFGLPKELRNRTEKSNSKR